MIRDPSDGSVKNSAPDVRTPQNTAERLPKREPARSGADTPSSANNWGLKSLDEPKRKPKPAPTKEELEAHYRKYGLGFQPKQTEGT